MLPPVNVKKRPARMTAVGVTIALLWFATFAFMAIDALFNEVITTGRRRGTRTFFGTHAQWVGAAFFTIALWPALLLLRERHAKFAALISVVLVLTLIARGRFG